MVYNGNLKKSTPPSMCQFFLIWIEMIQFPWDGDVPCTSHICHTLRLDALQGVLNAQKRRCRHLWESSCEPPQGVGPADPAPAAAIAASATLSLEECLDKEVPFWCSFRRGKRTRLGKQIKVGRRHFHEQLGNLCVYNYWYDCIVAFLTVIISSSKPPFFWGSVQC